ncbi:lysophospholipid acyltransferase family protein [Myxococcota bacterium]
MAGSESSTFRATKALGWFLLNVLQAVFLCAWSILWVSAALLIQVATFSQDAALFVPRRIWAPGLLWIAGARVEIRGRERVDYSVPHIFVFNHQSMADICVGFVSIPVPLRFIAKKVLAFVPFLGWFMWATGMVFVDRSKSRQAIRSLKKAGTKIRAGANIIAFPEGTRTRDGRIQPFKKGIFVVAMEARVPIVPVAVEGAYNVLPRDGYRVRPGVIRVHIGQPIDPKKYGPGQVDRLIRDVRRQMIAQHRAIGGAGGHLDDAVAPKGTQGNCDPQTEAPMRRKRWLSFR